MLTRWAFIVLCCVAVAGCQTPRRTFLINKATASPILQIESPGFQGDCSSTELHFTVDRNGRVSAQMGNNGNLVPIALSKLRVYDRGGQRVRPAQIGLGSGNPAEGPVMPVEGPDGLLWLCREDEEAQQCICIPWFPD
jgi:hypothetical protein